jgi:membrane fusion protein, copper/silver efflux system
MIHRRVLAIAAAAVLLVAALLFVFRGHASHLPLVGRWLPATTEASEVWTCPMHPEIRQSTPGTCPLCGMDLVLETGGAVDHDHAAHEHAAAGDAGLAPVDPRAPVQIDLRRQQLIGVRLTEVTEQRLESTVRAVGTVAYDETRVSEITLKIEGWIERLFADFTGQPIRQGQPLFTIYSPELLTTQNEFLLALRTKEQLESSRVDEARGYADRLVTAARQRLELWDLPAKDIEALERTRNARAHVTFPSPVSGVIIEKRAVRGMRVMPGEMLYRVADLSTVWVEADVYEADLASVRVGAHATVTLDAYPGERFSGRLAYLYPYVDEQTRATRVRLSLPNRHGRLKPGMYANVEFQTPTRSALAVPSDAVVDSGRAQFVFVSRGEGYFEPRQVRIGRRLNGSIEVLEGLTAGEQVVSGAAFFIDSESQLRAAMQSYEEAPPLAGGDAVPASTLQIDFSTAPDPPRHGDNTFEVRVRDADGAPVTDASVAVRLYMAPMPSMNMPAMRTDIALLHVGGGTYRGQGQISMGGRWDVTITATRDGQRLGGRTLALVAR